MKIVEYEEQTIGEVIKELRHELNLSQEELAKLAGVSKAAIGNYELGYLRPPIRVLRKIMWGLRVDEVRIKI